MAQDYKAIDENENMSDAPAQMKKNDDAMISNFAGAEEPSTKIQGQFYFDTSTNKLMFYNGSKFVSEIPCSISGTAARAKADESGRVIADTYLGKEERAKTAKALQTLERNTAYAVGDIAYSEQLPAGYYLECVTAGVTGNTEPTFNVGGVTLDGSAEWKTQVVASNAAVESVDTEIKSVNSNLDEVKHDLCIQAGDTVIIDYNIYINGTLTSSAQEIIVMINLNKIILAKKVTLISGRMLFRQNGKYYIGTYTDLTNILDVATPTCYVTPAGIRLYIDFNKPTEAQNNSPVAVQLIDLIFEFS